ncbi:bacteriohemerythrin [Phaeospirillum tilakii]|uniref:Bacteriohemerythrin n=1 Tax=Phaeospirillum tilakii TaxID=741673 RepID=A0ABW5CB44_9PROT
MATEIMKVDWVPTMETGIAAVDQDHRDLVGMINRLDDMLEARAELAGIGAVIDDLVAFAEHHFRREEEMLLRAGYPDAAGHGASHAGFSHRLGAMLAGCMIDPGPESIGRLHAHLQAWLVEHILTEDMRYVSFLRDAPPPP